MAANPYRSLPAVDHLVGSRPMTSLELGHEICVEAARLVLDRARKTIAQGNQAPDAPALEEEAAKLAQELVRPHLREVINATGVLIHTNLGRAPLSQSSIGHAVAYSNLEFDLEKGKRGSRRSHVERLLCELSGAEAALVVNNNAAAVLLLLAACARGKEVLISRSELVEIGGSFRVPDILEASGAILKEVGTTNRTYAEDYDNAVGPNTAAILKVHRSNFKVSGFVHEATSEELAEVAQKHGLPALHDLGSATFGPLPDGLPVECDVAAELEAGMDLVCFSGDKLLGGPQAGILLGRKDMVDLLAKHPMARALRVGKFTLAALQDVLLAYRRGAGEAVPLSAMLNAPRAALEKRAKRLRERLKARKIDADIVASADPIGGGSHPDVTIDGVALRLEPEGGVTRFAAELRRGDPPVVAVIREDAIHIHLRTVLERQEDALIETLAASLTS